MRIMFSGASPWTRSGYGKPLHYLLPRLVRAGHPCALSAFYGYQGATTVTQVDGEPVRIFGIARDVFFNDIIEYNVRSFGADLVISLQDTWILRGWGLRGFRWVPWMPVDCDPITVATLKSLEGCVFPMSFSKWGQEQLLASGWPQARYMPFGVDLEVHRIRDQGEARRVSGLPEDMFIAGMVAANSSYPSRKSFPEVLLAWKEWKAGGGEGILYLHTTVTPTKGKGIDLPQLLDVIGLEWSTLDDPDKGRIEQADVILACQHRKWVHAYSDESLAQLYSSFDVLLSPSMAEGFGIPILEAQACGVPVITQRFTSMPELTWSGECLAPLQMAWEEQGGWRALCDVKALTEAIAWADSMRNAPKGHEYYQHKARAHAEAFDWDTLIEERWLPMLEELADA